MKIRLALLATLIFSIASPTLSFAAGDRFALVIGNAKYPDADAPLKEPVNDARDVADELKRDGFTVEVGENLTGDGMRRAFDRLYGKIKPGSVALIFFSGYGIQSNRQSYMIPVDAQIWAEADVRRDGFSLETVLGEINSRGAGVKIALIDASRRNPFERRFRSFSAGLAPVIAPNGTLVMYSAALSSVVSDNGSDRSLFVRELLKEIRTPDLMAEETLNRTRVGVTRASRQEQVPWISSSLAEDFSFIPSGAATQSGAPGSPNAAPAPTASPSTEVTTAPPVAPPPAPPATTPAPPAVTPTPAPAPPAATAPTPPPAPP
ncbi:caspase family protein, partial [Bradyrhizobium sp. NAS96.2]|uniref:caspase family protein n=1 Tax=Bradyrhizobium sp. NAS96.2 TaxID=1680160 RepID=UPI0009695BC9